VWRLARDERDLDVDRSHLWLEDNLQLQAVEQSPERVRGNNGSIVEQGDHENRMGRRGFCYNLHHSQFVAALDEAS